MDSRPWRAAVHAVTQSQTSEATQPAGMHGVSICLRAPAAPLADGPSLLPPDSQLPLTRQDGAWGAVAGPAARLLRRSDSASILGSLRSAQLRADACARVSRRHWWGAVPR